MRVLKGHTGFVRALGFSADGKRAVTAGGDRGDGEVRVWDLATGACVQRFTGHRDGAYCALLANDGRRAVSGSRDGTVRMWDVETGECRLVIDAHRAHVQHLAWTADQLGVLSCSVHIRLWDTDVLAAAHDNTVRIWDLSSGRCLEVLRGRTLFVNASWLPGEPGIVARDEQAGVYLWTDVS
ncbi:MAG: hypothetical protein SGI92_28435 [Bryobacteraceae bacterium]|nr:hypothetical protein [Bryobacteraceae bacterium]